MGLGGGLRCMPGQAGGMQNAFITTPVDRDHPGEDDRRAAGHEGTAHPGFPVGENKEASPGIESPAVWPRFRWCSSARSCGG